MKTEILAAIGETGLRPAAALNAGLAANDRIKYAFSLLQVAMAHAEHPKQPAVTMKQERIACGIDDPDLDKAVAASRMAGRSCHIPGVSRIIANLVADIHLMAAPVLGAEKDGSAERLNELLARMPGTDGDLIDADAASAMMRAGKGSADSLHRLVMDLHKQLNTLQAEIAQETLDGAAVYNLDDAARPAVAAFMAGVNNTAKLKFNHPGLATSATSADGQLIIQNDIGTTDAHVIVIHVRALVVNVTYTDVHAERLAFFQSMLESRGVKWESTRTAVLAAGAPFYLATGSLTAKDEQACEDYLTFLGSRLVFLIDWNRARKQLRTFLRGPDRLALLLSLAATDVGHRGFLELGGAALVNQAIEATAGSAMHFGDRLCDVLGDAETQAFLTFACRTATQGLLSGESRALIQDRIRVALATHFSNEERQLLRIAEDHAGLIFELASLVRDGLQADADGSGKRARHARKFEHDADQLVVETREAVRRRADFAMFLTLLEGADDAADELEDAAFLLDLDALQGAPLEALQALADLLIEASQEWIKALGHASRIGGTVGQAETDNFLTAIDRVSALEHEADNAERALTVAIVAHAKDFRQLHLFTAIGGKFEAAADALKHASLILRDHVLEDIVHG